MARMNEPRSMNTFGIKYLSKGRPGNGLYAVKIEVGCVNGKHGRMEYLYEGNDKRLAEALAYKAQELMAAGGTSKVLEFKDYELDEWVKRYGY